MANVSKLIWTEKNTSGNVTSTHDNSLVFSKLGEFYTHGTHYYLPLQSLTSAGNATSTSLVYASDGKWYKLPSTAFSNTTYTLTNATSGNIVTGVTLSSTTFTESKSELGTLTTTIGSVASTTTAINATNSLSTNLGLLQGLITNLKSVTTSGMTFKGVATADVTSPTKGDTYKIGTAGVIVSTSKVGDTVVYDGSAWQLIPSGDDNAFGAIKVGTTTTTATSSKDVLTISGSDDITTSLSGTTVTIKHSTHTKGSVSGTSGSVDWGGSITIPSITWDGYGHVTGSATTNATLPSVSFASPTLSWGTKVNYATINGTAYGITLPSNPNVTSTLVSASTNASTTNSTSASGVYVNLKEGSAVNGSVKIVGGGSVTVNSTTSGTITISGATSLKNPNSITFTDGTNSVAYDGSSAKSLTFSDTFAYDTTNGLDLAWGTI